MGELISCRKVLKVGSNGGVELCWVIAGFLGRSRQVLHVTGHANVQQAGRVHGQPNRCVTETGLLDENVDPVFYPLPA